MTPFSGTSNKSSGGFDRGPRLAAAFLVGLLVGPGPLPLFAADRDENERPAAEKTHGEGEPGAAGREAREGAALRFTDDDLLKYRSGASGVESEGAPGPDGEQATRKRSAVAAREKRSAEPVDRPDSPSAALTASLTVEDPMKAREKRKIAQTQRAGRIEALRREITVLQKRLKYLEQKRQAILDPFQIMPRGQTPGDRQEDAELGAQELLEAVIKEIKAANRELKDAQQGLVVIQTRFDAAIPGAR